MIESPSVKRCPQCFSLGCGPLNCRFSTMSNEEFFDWQNAEGPERVRESQADEDWRMDYRQRWRDR